MAEVNATSSTADDEAATMWQVAHESILVSYGCKAHTHTHQKLHRKSTRENTAKSSCVDKVRTSTKLQLISDALRRRTQGEHTIE